VFCVFLEHGSIICKFFPLEYLQVIQQGRLFPGRERDTKEVEQYYQALQQVEKWTDEKQAITEDRIRKIHAIIYKERNVKPTPYRDGQNVIRDASGEIIYMPPEAEDVPVLMTDLVLWMHASEGVLPVPVIAGIAHYQFVTIHPFFDGNGRTARTLTTWILQRGGYALGKFYSLEEFYVEDLERYYKALITYPHHNYYFGRHEADITPWLSYFLNGMVIVFERVAEEVSRHLKAGKGTTTNVELLRPLDRRARRILSLFAEQETIQSCDVAALLGISTRQARVLLVQWVEQGWLVMTDASNKGRKCALEKKYIGLIKE
jgi:Fic family protein